MHDLDLARDLTDLAAAMPDDPARPAAVQRRARRLRQQRFATRGVAAGSGFALAVAGVAIAGRSTGSPHPVADGPTLPDCSAVPRDAPKSPDTTDSNGFGLRAKFGGTITAVPDAHTIVVHDFGGHDFTFTLTDATEVIDAAATDKGAAPSLPVGESVVVQALGAPTGPWTVEAVIVHPDAAPKVAKPDDSPTTMRKGEGHVVGAPTESSITIDDGTPATYTLTDHTKYFGNTDGTQCAHPNLQNGDHVGFVREGSTVLEVVLLP